MENDHRIDPAADLAGLDRATAGYAAATPGEGWYHALLGVGAGLAVVSQGLLTPWSIVLPLAFILTIPLFIHWWRTSHGWWVSGYTPRRARWVAAVLICVMLGLAVLSLTAHSLWVSIAAGVATAVIVTALGFVWMRVWRKGLRTTDAP